jgi:hypothetical protein
MLPRIVELLYVEDFKVYTRWTTDEIRCIDFARLVFGYPKWLRDKILTKEIFSTISLNKESRTMFIPNLLSYIDEQGNAALGELDFCPDVLYANSEIPAKTLQS